MKKLLWLFGLGLVSQSESCCWFDCCSGKGDVSTEEINQDMPIQALSEQVDILMQKQLAAFMCDREREKQDMQNAFQMLFNIQCALRQQNDLLAAQNQILSAFVFVLHYQNQSLLAALSKPTDNQVPSAN